MNLKTALALGIPAGFVVMTCFFCTSIGYVADQPAPVVSYSVEGATTPATPTLYFADCTQAHAAGYAPIAEGQPGFRADLDPDGNGVACG